MMTDPNHMHAFWPNRKGLCQAIPGRRGGRCGLAEDAPVHVRYAEKIRQEAEVEAASVMSRYFPPVCPKCGCSNIRVEWSGGRIAWIKCLGDDHGNFCDANAACDEEYAQFFSGE